MHTQLCRYLADEYKECGIENSCFLGTYKNLQVSQNEQLWVTITKSSSLFMLRLLRSSRLCKKKDRGVLLISSGNCKFYTGVQSGETKQLLYLKFISEK